MENLVGNLINFSQSEEIKGTLHPKIFSSPKAVNDRWNLSVWGRPSRKVKFLLCARSKPSETGRPAAFIRPQHTPDTPPQRHRSNVSQCAAVAIVTQVDPTRICEHTVDQRAALRRWREHVFPAYASELSVVF